MTKNSFKPPWWLRNSHLQTIWPSVFRKKIKLNLLRERFELPDGDFLDIDWAGKGNGPIVLVLHGFEGSINSSYSKGILQAIVAQGWRGAFMHFRSCSGEPNRLDRFYHSGDTKDVDTVLREFKKREPKTHFAAVGFSLGGNVLLKWLGETGENNLLKAAIAVSVPFELYKASHRLNHGFSRFYQWVFLQNLRLRVEKKFSGRKAPIPLPSLKDLKSIRDFDDKITAPLHGFLNAEDYYQKASCKKYLKKICTPTLLLNAKDDPFFTEDTIPVTEELSSAVQLEVTDKGGHVGFVAGSYPWKLKYWLDERIPLFLREYL